MIRKWTLRGLIFALLTLAVASLPLVAEDSATVQVGWTIESTQTLRILGSDGPGGREVAHTFAVPEPSEADLARGHMVREDALRLEARSNTDWVITARSERATMGASHDGAYTKPIQDLQVRADGGAYAPLSRERTIIARGTAGDETVGVDYRVDFDEAEYRPGDYRATVVYTISTP